MFEDDLNGDGIPNGIEYAFGGAPVLSIKRPQDGMAAETPVQAEASMDSVTTTVEASTDLVNWRTPGRRSGSPGGRSWWELASEPSAFFRVRGSLR